MDSPRLGGQARQTLASSSNYLAVSAASLWEMRIKEQKGTLEIPDDIMTQLTSWQVDVLSIDARLAYGAPAMQLPHSDPFDKMIICHAMQEQCTLMTADAILLGQEKYQVRMLDAKR